MIVDEVLAVGDANFQKKCLGKMDDVSKSGRTVLFVSHNLESIISLCDRVIWIDDGTIKGDGNPLKIVNKYLETINTISESKINLNSINREKLSSFQFTELSMFNQNNTETSSFNVGDDFSIKLKYTFKDQNLVGSNLQVKISLNNSTQTEVLNLNNEVTGFIHKLKTTSGEIICEIPKIPLGEGTYSISIQATINSGVSDILKEICSFEIIPGDYFGTGIANITKSNYYCKSNWK